jgi:hypothetical protein
MPRRYRFKPDYSHLLGVSLDTVLDAAIQRRGYGKGDETYPAEANANVLKLFKNGDWISRQDLRLGADVVQGARGWSPEFALDVIGNTVGWGLHLNLIKEVPGPDGERGYSLIERETVYEVIAGKAVRVIGLPADEQVAMNVRRSRLRRLHATLALKRAIKVRRAAEPLIDRMIAADRDAKIPDEFRTYLDAQFFELSEEMTVRHLREYLLEAPDGWDAYLQKHWLRTLARAAEDAERRAQTRRELEAEAAAAEVILPEDMDAFAGI